MERERIVRALGRIEAAAGRIEAAAHSPTPQTGDPELQFRHDELRKQTTVAIAEIDALMRKLSA